jgi:hypothetical protein
MSASVSLFSSITNPDKMFVTRMTHAFWDERSGEPSNAIRADLIFHRDNSLFGPETMDGMAGAPR